MPKYKYKGKTLDNKNTQGYAEAPSNTELYNRLKLQNVFVYDITEVAQSVGTPYKLKAAQISDFSRQISSMISAGIPILRSLEIIRDRTKDQKLVAIYNKLYITISLGNNIGTAMERCDGAFPNIMINMFKSGESAGKLDTTAKSVADYYEKEHKLNSKISGAMAYPTILMFLTICVTITIFTFIIPKFVSLYTDMELPLITKIILWISNLITTNWGILIILSVLLVCGIIYLCKLPHIVVKIHKTILRLPIVGKLLSVIYSSRFCRTLSSLYGSGIPILEAISITSTVIGNKYMENAFSEVLSRLRAGVPLSSAMTSVDGFDDKLISTIYIGEESGKLDEMLTSIANSYEYESEMATAKLITYIEPVMIVLMALVIGTIMLAVLLPILSTYGQIG